jgi:hypothetical protein
MFGNPVVDRRGEEVFANKGFAYNVAVDERRGWVRHGVVKVERLVGTDLQQFFAARDSIVVVVGEGDARARARGKKTQASGGDESLEGAEDDGLNVRVFVVDYCVDDFVVPNLC